MEPKSRHFEYIFCSACFCHLNSLGLLHHENLKSRNFDDSPSNSEFQKTMALKKCSNAEDIFKAIESDVKFIDITFGNILLFSQTILHGNRVNYEDETRWSMNCRFKSLLSPYADKKLGEFFEPIIVKPATRLGMMYELSDRFNE